LPYRNQIIVLLDIPKNPGVLWNNWASMFTGWIANSDEYLGGKWVPLDRPFESICTREEVLVPALLPANLIPAKQQMVKILFFDVLLTKTVIRNRFYVIIRWTDTSNDNFCIVRT
jgi:hypothetical protein